MSLRKNLNFRLTAESKLGLLGGISENKQQKAPALLTLLESFRLVRKHNQLFLRRYEKKP